MKPALILITLITVIAAIGCTHRTEEITVGIPKGYAAPTPLPKDSWEEKMKRVMAQGLESEAVAAAASEQSGLAAARPQPSVVPTKSPAARRALTTRAGRAHSHGKLAARRAHSRHTRRHH
jgi:hypothetical protein